eukprot:12515628-Heterocapsa_arctica.AAC.1
MAYGSMRSQGAVAPQGFPGTSCQGSYAGTPGAEAAQDAACAGNVAAAAPDDELEAALGNG